MAKQNYYHLPVSARHISVVRNRTQISATIGGNMDRKEEVASPLMDFREVAKFAHLAEGTIRDLVYKRRVPYIKLLGRVLFRRSDIEAWINASEVPAKPVQEGRSRGRHRREKQQKGVEAR
jgi:predicted DNA-binding transcriptional regulator AlpA